MHYFADENVELSIVLFADFGDFEGAQLIAVDNRALLRRGVTGREFNNDARG